MFETRHTPYYAAAYDRAHQARAAAARDLFAAAFRRVSGWLARPPLKRLG